MTVESIPPAISISPAAAVDVEAVAPLFDQYRQFYGQAADLDGARRFLAQRIAAGESLILLARQAEDAVGFTQLFPSFSSVGLKRIWILNDLFVVPRARNLGVATALLDRAVEHAAATSAARLVLATARNNAPARSLYARCAWQEDTEFVHYVRRI